MAALVIVVAIIGIAVVFQGLLLMGLLRAYRRLGAASSESPEMSISPQPGVIISTVGLPPELHGPVTEAVSGVQMVALLTTSCRACEQALETFARTKRFSVPLTIIVGQRGDWPAGMRETLQRLPSEVSTVVTEAALDSLAGLGDPDGFPTLLVLTNGVVVHATYSPGDALGYAAQLTRA